MTAAHSTPIELVPLTSLDLESQMKVRDIRNEENVRKWMYTDHVIGINEHLAWVSRLKQDNGQLVFVALDEERSPRGVVGASAIDRLHKKADWAYYLTETARGGLGSALEYSFINFIFDVLRMDKLNCEVIEGNNAVVKLHKKFLFQEEGFKRSNIVKNGARLGVYFLGLTREDWLTGKDDIQNRYKEALQKFSVSIRWSPADETLCNPIDQIEAARARNNLNWMGILRLALEKSPDIAKPIVAEIKRIDREISDLTDKLTEKKEI